MHSFISKGVEDYRCPVQTNGNRKLRPESGEGRNDMRPDLRSQISKPEPDRLHELR